LRNLVKTIGNYVPDDVPVSKDEEDNVTVRTWEPEPESDVPKAAGIGALLAHHEVLQRLDGYDAERGVKLAGHRGYCLTGWGLLLCVSFRFSMNH
jgi:seryl-tRNA synthetase